MTTGKGPAAADERRPPAPTTIALLLFLLFAAIYAGFRSNDHYYDSVDYALIVEGDDQRLFWPKHLLQHALVKLIHQVQLALGFGARGLRTAQLVNAFAAAGAVSCFFALLARVTADRWLAVCSALLLGFSAAVARHAVEGEVYALPLFFLSVALVLASRSNTPKTAALVGGAQAASVLMHQSYAIFVPALGVYLALRSRRNLWPWAAALALPVLAAYGAVFLATGLPLRKLPQWLRPEAPWMELGTGSLHGMAAAFLHAFSPSEAVEPKLSAARLPAPAAIAAAFAIGVPAAWRRFRHELILCVLLVAIYAPVVIIQGPTFQYFPPLVVAILLAAALSLHTADRRMLIRRALVSYTALFSAASVAFTLVPAHTRSDSLDRADFAGRASRPGDRTVVLGSGSSVNDPVYFPYFARRAAISLWQLECCSDPSRELLDELEEQIDRTLLAGARVFLFDDLLAPGGRFRTPLGGWFEIGGAEVRASLEKRYRLVDRGEYLGRGYAQRWLEITRLVCGPEPHFKSIGAECLPSCGVLVSALGAPSAGACCPRGCLGAARLLGRTWDCQACCGGQGPVCR